MPFTLFAPGTRKNNRFWVAIVRVDGRQVELSTKAATKTAARDFARDTEVALIAERTGRAKAGAQTTFAEAAALYAAFRGFDLSAPKLEHGRRRQEVQSINRLIGELGRLPIGEIQHADLIAAANRLYPGRVAATKNREAIRPAASILHYAADNKLIPWLRIKVFKEPRPKTRAVGTDTAAALVTAAPDGPRRLLLVWLFRVGTRVSDTVRVTWEAIDLSRQTVRIHIRKTDSWVELPLHPEVFEMLAATPEEKRHGRLFPWTQRTGVYRWLRPLAKKLDVTFTPHMARHSVGTWLNEQGAGLRTIMAALGHADPKSSIRYQMADVEVIRAAARGMAPLARREQAA
jgi:integrase